MRDAGMRQMFTNMQQQHYHPNFSQTPGTPTTPVAMGSMDWSSSSRTSYASPFIILPNTGSVGGIHSASPFVASPMNGQSDVAQYHQYLSPTVYPSVIPSSYPAWQYVSHYDVQDRQNQSVDGSPMQYYPATWVPSVDGNTVANYSYVTGYAHAPLPWQMMKTTAGYVLQDMEAVTQQEPAIPHAVPAMWTNPSDLTIAKCLENREGITNVYIRGFLPETTDELLKAYAARFGQIERCKAIIDLDTGLCKGFGFVQFSTFEACENCIRGFYYLGYQASFAQKSRNSRLKDLEDRSSTNIYCTNIPIEWTEADLRRHFEPYNVVSEKISRDEKTGVSKEVGFARFDTREIAEQVLSEFHNVQKDNGAKLLLRFADTKAQKMLKQQSNERRAYRAGEYNYSVDVVQGSTPSPLVHCMTEHLTPNSHGSFGSPVGLGSNWTPATSISPTWALMKKAGNGARQASQSSRTLDAMENTPAYRRPFPTCRSMTDLSGGSSKTAMPPSPSLEPRSYLSTPRKENARAVSMSPMPSRMSKLAQSSPRSVV